MTNALWAKGDYRPIASLIAGLSDDLVGAAHVKPGQRVLDVGTGTGNTALLAAEAGADVVAADPTPELLDIGRADAARRGLSIEWVEAGAEAMPFEDESFDLVLSSIGAMFAPDHQATANEMRRVCRPGGLIAMVNWPPHGSAGNLFRTIGKYAATPPPVPAPSAWGDPDHVRDLFKGLEVTTEVKQVTLAFSGTPQEFADVYLENFAPIVAASEQLGDDRRVDLHRDVLAFATIENKGEPGGPGLWVYDYLLVLVTV